MKIEWDASLEIGVEIIDQEHREIIEHFHHLYEEMRVGKGLDSFQSLLDFLEKYVNEHLAHEEALQKEIQYPDILEHTQIHMAFREKVKSIIASYEETEVTNADLIKLNLFIKEWLINHIMTVDMKLGAYINAKK